MTFSSSVATVVLNKTPFTLSFNLVFNRFYLGIGALLILAGCATTQSVSVESRTRTYEHSYEDVFDAVVSAFAADGYAVVTADRENGIINTDERVRSGMQLFEGNRTKVTALVREKDEVVSVILNLSTTTANETGGEDVQIMLPGIAREFYRDLFDQIAAQL